MGGQPGADGFEAHGPALAAIGARLNPILTRTRHLPQRGRADFVNQPPAPQGEFARGRHALRKKRAGRMLDHWPRFGASRAGAAIAGRLRAADRGARQHGELDDERDRDRHRQLHRLDHRSGVRQRRHDLADRTSIRPAACRSPAPTAPPGRRRRASGSGSRRQLRQPQDDRRRQPAQLQHLHDRGPDHRLGRRHREHRDDPAGPARGTAQSVTVYGRVASGQTSVPAGAYADTVAVTVLLKRERIVLKPILKPLPYKPQGGRKDDPLDQQRKRRPARPARTREGQDMFKTLSFGALATGPCAAICLPAPGDRQHRRRHPRDQRDRDRQLHRFDHRRSPSATSIRPPRRTSTPPAGLPSPAPTAAPGPLRRASAPAPARASPTAR